MKRTSVVLDLIEGKLVPHSHPVFTGDVAYDLRQEEQVEVVDNLRSFPGGVGEVLRALNDYKREHPKAEQEPVGTFYVIEVFSDSETPIIAKAKAKAKPKSK